MDSFIFRQNDMKMRREEKRREEKASVCIWKQVGRFTVDKVKIKCNKKVINSCLKIEL